MNFLAHLWLSDRAGLPLAGAVLGDVVRGRLDGRLPSQLERSIALHRRIDAVTDSHPRIAAARAGFEPGARRYAGIVLDVLHDHALARRWPEQPEALTTFTQRAAAAVADPGAWQLASGRTAPEARRFAAMLSSYREPDGIDQAFARLASRLARPQPLLDAAEGWRHRMPDIEADSPGLMTDLETAALSFVAEALR